MEKGERIFIAFHEGMIGSAIRRRLIKEGFNTLLVQTASQLDIIDQKAVSEFFVDEKPDYVLLPSAKVGGIMANSQYPAEFIYQNIQAQTNIIHAAWKCGVKKLLFLGSSCIYPKECPQPMKEEYLLTGQLEPTSEPYAVAKIAGIKMCQAYNRQYGTQFVPAVPADVYGPGDDFNPETGHVLPALISKIHQAKIVKDTAVTVWGTGTPRRETLHVDDLAKACIFLMNNYRDSEMINIGSGEDISIKEMAQLVKDVVGYTGNLTFDTSKPDGMPRKLLDNTKIKKLGWSPRINARDGIRQTCQWYKNNLKG
jgi:GDP-L-fucose synthase